MRSLFPGVVYRLGVLIGAPCVVVEFALRQHLGYQCLRTHLSHTGSIESRSSVRVNRNEKANGWEFVKLSGGQRRDRTADAGLFRAALYH
jgi:hypothetical protein